MIINMRDYPELIEDIMRNTKIKDVFSTEGLKVIRDTMLKDKEEIMWDEWGYDRVYEGLESETMVELAIKKHSYAEVFEDMNASLAEFEKNYPYYLESVMEVESEYSQFVERVMEGKAVITLYKGDN